MKKKLYHYSFDSVFNPRYGGGGAWRDLKVHAALTDEYDVHLFVGSYADAKDYEMDGVHVHMLGWGARSHLLNRIVFALIGTFHSLFCQADVKVVAFSVFSPILSFLIRPNKIILVYHHYLGKLVFRMHGIAGVLPFLVELLLLRYSKYVITSAESVANFFATYKGRKKCVRAVYNGYSPDLLTTKPRDERYILTFGRIDIYMKGLDILIPAFEIAAKSCPGYKLLIAGRGKGGDVQILSRRIEQSFLKDDICLTTNVNEDEKKTLLQNASFVCIPSRFEGWCIVSLEASASAKAVLGTDIWGLNETIKNHFSGILVPPENLSALSDGMLRLMRDEKLRGALGKNGRKWAKKFSWEITARLQRQFYQQWRKRNAKA